MSSPSSLGAYLRRCRERSGLSVETVATRSRILPRLIRALEDDRHDALPAPVYVRGFVRAYCAEVGVVPDEALALYEARILALAPPSPTVPAPPVRRGRLVLLGAVVLAGLVAAGALFVLRPAASPGLGGRATAAGSSRSGQTPPAAPAPGGAGKEALGADGPTRAVPGGAGPAGEGEAAPGEADR